MISSNSFAQQQWLPLFFGIHFIAMAQSGPGAITVPSETSQTPRFPALGCTSSMKNPIRVRRPSLMRRAGYRLPSLAAGRYRVEVTIDGFDPFIARQVALQPGQTIAIDDATLKPARITEGVVVTARRIEEAAQEVPIPVSVVSGNVIADAGAFNVNRLKEASADGPVLFHQSAQLVDQHSRAGRALPGSPTTASRLASVSYIDGAFYARPASATLDFLDVERIEVLRGPQGTLFGKNTTAGAINVTTRKPTFAQESDVELNFGNVGFVQTKASLAGPLLPKVAGRFSFSGTTRDGTVHNTVTRRT